EDFALASGALTRNKPVLADANAFRDREQIMRVSEDVSHVLIIPMRIRGQRTGVAYLGFTSFPVLDQTDEIFASVWGRQCAQAIDTAMLFHQVGLSTRGLRAVSDHLPQAVRIVDRDGMTVSVANRAVDELWGFAVETGTDARRLSMLDSEGAKLEGRKHPLARTMETGQKTVGEPLFIPQPDGTQVKVLGNHAPILDARDTTIGVVSVLQNRADFETDRKSVGEGK